MPIKDYSKCGTILSTIIIRVNKEVNIEAAFISFFRPFGDDEIKVIRITYIIYKNITHYTTYIDRLITGIYIYIYIYIYTRYKSILEIIDS